jgi:hypothetical protein
MSKRIFKRIKDQISGLCVRLDMNKRCGPGLLGEIDQTG